MERSLSQLADVEFDLCVIGGGIYGACAAWDAALRGLSVALVEKSDFGHATSFNSQNTIHGGFRYLQDFDVPRVRAAVRERRRWMGIAPHLVHPMPFLIPTYRHHGRPKRLFQLGFGVYDMLSMGRNSLPDPQKRIPSGRLVSHRECLELLGSVADDELTGGALYYDALIHNSERLGLSILRAASSAGAVIANYVEAVGFLQQGGRLTGVRLRDALTEDEFELRARFVLNTSGPWVNRILQRLGGGRPERVSLQKVMYLAIKKPVFPCAVGLLGDQGGYFFTIPWHEHTLVGAAERPFRGDEPSQLSFTEQEVEAFIAEISRARPAIGLRREDVVTVRGGLVPADESSVRRGRPEMTKKARVIDHRKDVGIDGLVSVVGIKYTMARAVAERIIGQVFSRLGQEPPRSRSSTTRAHGGEIERFDAFVEEALRRNGPGLGEDLVRHLVLNYGSEYPAVLSYLELGPEMKERVSAHSRVTRGEVVHALREEMTERLSDLVLRRTELGILGYPGDDALSACGDIMARERGWTAARTEREIEEVRSKLSRDGEIPAAISKAGAPG